MKTYPELFRLLIESPRFVKATILGSLLGYVVGFIALAGELGLGVMALSLVPLVVTAQNSKVRGGLLVGTLLFPLNALLLLAIGEDWTIMIRDGAPGSIALIVAGAIVGRMSQLSAQLKARNAELSRQHELVREQTESRIKAERDKSTLTENIARGVGHDLRLPLTAISSTTEALRGLASWEGREKFLDVIDQNLIWADRMIWNLWNLADETELSFSEVEPNSIVQKALSKIGIPPNVTVRTYCRDNLALRVDIGKFEHILSNLLLNAVQAMPDGGELEISTLMEGDAVKVTIRDTGVGIPTDNKNRLFIPFFTTKGRGMGLGLVSSKKVIESHQGTIQIESQKLVGTTVTLRLPRSSRI